MILSEEELSSFLGERLASTIGAALQSIVLQPANALLARSSKRLRGQLVRLGSRCGALQDERIVAACERVMERLHAGSLIIDDIEDASEIRRGEPCVHVRYGLPVALNTGNLLYFWPLRGIFTMGTDSQTEIQLYRLYHRALLLAHIGQAMDLGLAIDEQPPEKMFELSNASLELKSGALTALGLTLGATATKTSSEVIQALEEFGTRFGIALQMFDDLGNFKGRREPEKRYEDLRLRRPSWMWAVLAKFFPELLGGFREAVRCLPDTNPMDTWASLHDSVFVKAKLEAFSFLDTAVSQLGNTPLPADVHSGLKNLSEQLKYSYE